MQIFFLNGLWRLLKDGHLPIKLHSSAPPGLETDAVDVDILLLLSKVAMKKRQTVLDFNKDIVTMFGKEQPLFRPSSGHYAIPLCSAPLGIQNSESKIRKVYRYSLTSVETIHVKIKRKLLRNFTDNFVIVVQMN